MVYAITYDLNKIGQDYSSLYLAIQSLGETARPLQNLWLASTTKTAAEARQILQMAIDSNDSVFVVRVNRGQWDCYMSQSDINWLNARV